jgi:hypothetical protein
MPRATSGGWLPRSFSVRRHRSVTDASPPSVSARNCPGGAGSRLQVVVQGNTRRHMAVDVRTFMLGSTAWTDSSPLGTRTAPAALTGVVIRRATTLVTPVDERHRVDNGKPLEPLEVAG